MPNRARVAVYTDSFDPITLGHLNVISRGSQIFDRLIVGVGINPEKKVLFSPEERVALIQESVADLDNVEARSFTGLAVHFVRAMGARIMLRGVRFLADIDAEMTMSLANHQLDPEIETVFLMAGAEYSHISSTLIKQIVTLASDESLARFVPAPVIPRLREKFLVPKS